MKNHGFTLACDMDGVLSDFEKRVSKIMENFEVQDEKKRKSQMWKAINWSSKTEPFFLHLEKMADADELIAGIRELFHDEDMFICSATGRNAVSVSEQKREWIRKNYDHFLRVELVSNSAEKAQFASPTCILIDDRSKSIDPWVAAGGIGILHTDAKTTLSKLKDILTEKGA